MFSLDYTGDEGAPRKLHVGLVPTTSVETLGAAGRRRRTAETAAVAEARRLGEMRQIVETYRALANAEAWIGPVDHVANAMDAVDLWLIDLADFLHALAPRRRGRRSAAPASRAGLARAPQAAGASTGSPTGSTLAARVHRGVGRGARRCSARPAARAQTLALHLDGVALGGATPARRPTISPPTCARRARSSTRRRRDRRRDTADPRAPRRPKLDPSGQVEHVIRCAYVRPHCEDRARPDRQRADRALPARVVLRPGRARARRAHRAADRHRRQGPAQAAQVGDASASPSSSSAR